MNDSEFEKSYEHCELCPRRCGVNRASGEVGICGADSAMRIARAALHHFEEPPISGGNENSGGSGAVFFAYCPLHCVYCQNHKISGLKIDEENNPWVKAVVSSENLARVFLKLKFLGALNINLVSASHYAPSVINALKIAKLQGLGIPIIYNTSGYENIETLKAFDGLVDIYLTDFKYMDAGLAQKYSKAFDYPDIAKAALDEMFRQIGSPVYTEDPVHGELLKRGVVVRHLVLPGCKFDSFEILKYLNSAYSSQVVVSLMSQYIPLVDKEKFPELSKRIDPDDYRDLVSYGETLDFEDLFIQEPSSAIEEYIPEFDGLGVIK